MSTRLSDALDGLKQPQYTGANRCVPCTVVNVALAMALGVGLSIVATPFAGVPAVVVSLTAIYLRGYLIPGTPELTKRYFPDWLLAWFDKEPTESGTATVDSAGRTDPEALLSSAEAVEPCAEEDDLCLIDSFAAAWRDEIRRLRTDEARHDALRDFFGVDSLSVDPAENHVSVHSHDTHLARWPSDGAMIADVAADRALASRAPEWAGLAPAQRSDILAGLRSFLENCPLCDAPVELGERTVESCCRSWEVVSVHCTACDTGLLELDPETLETVA
jgi:hypothetical protein